MLVEKPLLKNAKIAYYPNFLNSENADLYFNKLINSLQWGQDSIKIFGKTIPQPRLTALYATNGKEYKYSGLTLTPANFTAELFEIQQKLAKVCEIGFTHCLANLYRDGNDSMGWHSDDEKSLGKNPAIASVSLGEKRKFSLKHKTIPNLKKTFYLEHGSLLVMKGTTQHYWKHQVPKSKNAKNPRINLTFRRIF